MYLLNLELCILPDDVATVVEFAVEAVATKRLGVADNDYFITCTGDGYIHASQHSYGTVHITPVVPLLFLGR